MTELVYVKGLDELNRRLGQLPADIAKHALRRAVSKAAAVVRDAARAAAPISAVPVRRKGGRVDAPGTLKRSALIKFDRQNSNDTQVEYIVAFRKGKKLQKSNRDAFYASWVEFGHKITPRVRKGQILGRTLKERRKAATGSVPPHPYFGPAWKASQYQALNVLQATLTDEIAKANTP